MLLLLLLLVLKCHVKAKQCSKTRVCLCIAYIRLCILVLYEAPDSVKHSLVLKGAGHNPAVCSSRYVVELRGTSFSGIKMSRIVFFDLLS